MAVKIAPRFTRSQVVKVRCAQILVDCIFSSCSLFNTIRQEVVIYRMLLYRQVDEHNTIYIYIYTMTNLWE